MTAGEGVRKVNDRRILVVLVLSLAVQVALVAATLVTKGEIERMQGWMENVCEAVENVGDDVRQTPPNLIDGTVCL